MPRHAHAWALGPRLGSRLGREGVHAQPAHEPAAGQAACSVCVGWGGGGHAGPPAEVLAHVYMYTCGELPGAAGTS